ncbi:probable beta-1,3-galactosyltransferase 2 [Diospyros lotus]|uniref:probable beta-1,3-galactosyltransferase 2 n=1 Tax=Diospyros lotus TaxID=55363 RepID=UPI002254EAB1|nr:probable beta-1,3-galactosyltransferase 2 [Diospyros lotus]
MSMKSRGTAGESHSKASVSRSWVLLLCLASFCAGLFFTNRIWLVPETTDIAMKMKSKVEAERRHWVSQALNSKLNLIGHESNNNSGELLNAHHANKTLGSIIRKFPCETAVGQTGNTSLLKGYSASTNQKAANSKRKYFMVIGVNTALYSRSRRDSLRQTWFPREKKLEEEKGIVICFVVGHSSTSGDALDKAIEAEDREHGDFLRLEHVEGYHELSAKTKIYFATAVTSWNADFYVKIDDDVHVNIGRLSRILHNHLNKPRVYIGCMKSGPVLYEEGVKYYEPEYWKFGDEENNYFRHATGQIYAISKELASYILANQNLLHKYANEDVSLGSWFIGLEVEHVDDRRMCCGSIDECQVRALIGLGCVATFNWRCSGICRSTERILGIHQRCKEPESVLWGESTDQRAASSLNQQT